MPGAPDPLAPFHPLTRGWFTRAFAAPTGAQAAGWPRIAAGEHTLILAPTGSGKTLAAFLWAIDRLVTAKLDDAPARRVLYVSPLKALNYDVERNLAGPLAGLADAARRDGRVLPEIGVAVRTGDTPQNERQKMLRTPPDILITTPESLYLLLTSRGREILKDVGTVIVDEIHAVAATKRGTHLALSLERLEELVRGEGGALQRIGLSATQRPLQEVARFLGGNGPDGARPVAIADAGAAKDLDLEVVVPVNDMAEVTSSGPERQAADLAPLQGGEDTRRSIWPSMYPRLLELIRAHTSTLVFVNNRRLAERLAIRLNELAGEEVARAHHGSLARDQRVIIEEDLKAGRIPALVATSSLELGIDMGAIDLVIQVESPRSVATGIQRVGRAGHGVGRASRGRIFPKYRGDLLECAAVVHRMRDGEIERTTVPRLPLDVLAQQLVAACVDRDWHVPDLLALVRGAYPFTEISREQFDGVLDMLAGRYPSDEFAELRPRLAWDRGTDVVRGRPGIRQLTVQNAGTIPDRGLYGVYLADGTARVGELDEEMVYEARAGQTFMLGASTWRIEQITHDRVLVSPAPGAPGAVPFWRGEGVGRPAELGAAVGALARELLAAPPDEARARLARDSRFDARAAENLVRYLHDQAEATGALPSDRTVVIERFRDEIGDWRICLLSPFGARVHAPWAMALSARIREETGQQVHPIWSDDGIALHLPETDEAPDGSIMLIDADEVDELVIGELASSALFGARFRENAGRALLIPRRRPGQRTPLWQQRLRASALLQVARRYGSFPVILETYRECLNDWFDLPALRDVLGGVATRRIAVVEADTDRPSPFTSTLMFEYVATYMYDDDAPVAERRAQALALDRDLLRELLGDDGLRELLDADAIAAVEADLQHTSERARAAHPDALHDLLRIVGDLTAGEVAARLAEPSRADAWLEALRAQRRAVGVRVAGEDRWIAAEDVARYRDGLGVMPPPGLPDALLAPTDDALVGLVGRYARTHGPFTAADAAARLGIAAGAAEAALEVLRGRGTAVEGEMLPGGSGREWCDTDVLRRLRRASMAALRAEVEPVEHAALGAFLPTWQGVDRATSPGGPDALRDVIAALQGVALPAAQWENEVFPRRLGGYSPAWLDQLAAEGSVRWLGVTPTGGGRVALYLREDAALLAAPPGPVPDDAAAAAVAGALAGGALFWDELLDAAGVDAEGAFAALWRLVWAGRVANDTWTPLRAPRRLPVPPPASRHRVGRRARRPSAAGRAVLAGRWASTDSLFAGAPSPAQQAQARAELLLERHGVVTRGAAIADGTPGGFAAVYPALARMEITGACRRGYFVDGLGGAQFAVPGAVDRLRDMRPGGAGDAATLVLGAADPAQAYGASLPWPAHGGSRTPSRVHGAYVVTRGGRPVLYVERGGRGIVTFEGTGDLDLDAGLAALTAWVTSHRARVLRPERVDGVPVTGSAWEERLESAGFRRDLRGMILRA
ncbi:MAG: DEAD/DEAH box helicase [Thermoleophilia bacterium]|nr:DEAD/DEAH box helicase [Thermoleophilia bacterium]